MHTALGTQPVMDVGPRCRAGSRPLRWHAKSFHLTSSAYSTCQRANPSHVPFFSAPSSFPNPGVEGGAEEADRDWVPPPPLICCPRRPFQLASCVGRPQVGGKPLPLSGLEQEVRTERKRKCGGEGERRWMELWRSRGWHIVGQEGHLACHLGCQDFFSWP